MIKKEISVMSDGKVEKFFLQIGDKSYFCEFCGCNVFYKLNINYPNKYKCNSCNKSFEAG